MAASKLDDVEDLGHWFASWARLNPAVAARIKTVLEDNPRGCGAVYLGHFPHQVYPTVSVPS